MKPTIIGARELRAHPELVEELRAHGSGDHIERRTVPLTNVAVRAKADGSWVGEGLAATFGDLSVNLGGFREVIERGAFRKVLAGNPDTRALQNHDPNYVLGRTTAGTLRLEEVPRGLSYEFDAPDTSYARDLRVLLDRGDVNQSSFAFRVTPEGQTWEEDDETGGLIRRIHEFSGLLDVSPVTYPAYPTTTSGARSATDTLQSILGQMLDLAAQYCEVEDDEDDEEVMDGIAKSLSDLVADNVADDAEAEAPADGANSSTPTGEQAQGASAAEPGREAPTGEQRSSEEQEDTRPGGHAVAARRRRLALRARL